MKGGIKDMAQDAARQTILDAITAEQQGQQAQPQQPGQAVLPNLPNLTLPQIPVETLKAITELAAAAKGIIDAWKPQDNLDNLSMGNEKMLKSIGARWLNILLGRADRDLQKIEKSVGITDTSMLHEVV